MKTGIININNFSGGISDDVREQKTNVFYRSQHFDIWNEPHKLTPRREFQDYFITGQSPMATLNPCRQLYAPTTSGNYKYFALAETNSKVFILDRAADIEWFVSSTGTGVVATRNTEAFEYYQHALYGWHGNNQIFEYGNLDGTRTFDNTVTTITGVNTRAPGLVGRNDALYLPYNNKLLENDNGVWDSNSLVLPEDVTITSIANHGDKLAIATKHAGQYGNVSKTFLWDFVSDDVSDVIDWGEGELKTINSIGGSLVGVSHFTRNPAERIVQLRVYSGGSTEVIKEITFGSGSTNLDIHNLSRVHGNRMYFIIDGDNAISGNTLGLWVLGRKGAGYPWAVTQDTYVHNYYGYYDFFFSGSILSLFSNTNIPKSSHGSANFSQTSSWVSQKYYGSGVFVEKGLNWVKTGCEALSSGGKLRVDYRVDDSATWTVLDSISIANTQYLEIGRELDGNNLSNFREVQFRLVSTGGAEPTHLQAKYTELDTGLGL